MPKSMAAVIWQYNDCWPCSTWSMVDYYRREKALLFQSRHFFAPVLVSGLPDADTGQADLYVTSDQRNAVSAELRWEVTDLAGEVLRQGSKQINISAGTSRRVEELDLSGLVKAHGAENLLVWPEVMVGGRVVAQNTLFFGRPKMLKLKRPDLRVSVSGGETQYRVVIQSDVPALWTWVNVDGADARYSDNFIHVSQSRAAEIEINLDKPLSPFDVRRMLKVRSVYDIAPEMQS